MLVFTVNTVFDPDCAKDVMFVESTNTPLTKNLKSETDVAGNPDPLGGCLNDVFKNIAVLDVVDAEFAFLVSEVFKYNTVSVFTDPLTIVIVLSMLVTLTPSGI